LQPNMGESANRRKRSAGEKNGRLAGRGSVQNCSSRGFSKKNIVAVNGKGKKAWQTTMDLEKKVSVKGGDKA